MQKNNRDIPRIVIAKTGVWATNITQYIHSVIFYQVILTCALRTHVKDLQSTKRTVVYNCSFNWCISLTCALKTHVKRAQLLSLLITTPTFTTYNWEICMIVIAKTREFWQQKSFNMIINISFFNLKRRQYNKIIMSKHLNA